jgi:hypothetical protein
LRPAACGCHHLSFTQNRALGRKVSDEFTVPLCRGHHREVHHCGAEAAWWAKAGIDPTIAARTLWLKTHPLPLRRGKNVQTPAVLAAQRGNQSHDHPLNRQKLNHKTKPIIAADPSFALNVCIKYDTSQ